ncbi:AAA family ATPase [Aquihabitans sp. G128]|uniref:adenylate/guanylate cyclase domain-containing protein n=1 Tax=Aquihabitans sp. G128 TaxID=2849779 RepID=UPI001C24C127|nr:adenylate/guanylate cyclase domain-containing protein [Aquihabitans sp. G128]QXC63365.1 AAA family ATPase [Aquihabitans sp. G128]
MICSACGATADDAARFCASCGRSLRTEGDERRVVTVLFADLVGFTSLSERLDPERVKNLVDRCFERLAADVTAFGGQVDKIVGDALVALFGAPVAHEDDAERAVRAALRMQETLLEEVAEIGQALQIRVGVNTGEVLVGAMRAAGSVTAMGDVVNTASRLQTSAEPGEVLVGPATHQATAHTIAYEPRGLLAAKGRDEPVETWRAVAPTLPPGHRARRVDVPLVGRDHELGLLRHAVDTSITNGRALMVLLMGDVGMGKSRLADEVSEWASKEHGVVVREGRCVPYGEANVWWPVADALRDGLGVGDGESLDEDRAAALAQVGVALRRPVTDPEVGRTTEGLLTLLGHEPPAGADPTTVREEAGRALGVYAAALSDHRPLVLQISDLHWADDAVLTLIDDIFATVHHCPIVVLATARPALLDQWTPRPGRHNTLVLHLDPLGREAASALLTSLVGRAVPPEVADVVLDRSGGNPFFLEELVSLLDGAAGAGPNVATLPDTLRGLVAARLDDLDPSARSILQDAAVIGQRGPVAGLREMARHLHADLDVDVALAQLVDDEIMELEDHVWSFRSDLVREVAYQTVTKADRAKSHLGIAHYLEEAVATRRPRPAWVVDQLAHHYATAVSLAGELGPVGRTAAFPADLADQARRWVVEAAERAGRDQALDTAIRLYGQALTLLGPEGSVPPAEVARLHLDRAVLNAEVWDLGAARADVDQACALAEEAGDPLAQADALVIRGRIEQKEGDVDAAVASLTDAVARYQALDAHAGRAEALRQRGMAEIFGGRMAEAQASATAALAAFEEVGDRTGQGWAMQNLAWTAFVLGHLAEADEHIQAAVERFSDPVDTRGLAWSLGLLSWIRFQQHRIVEAAALGEQVLGEARSRNDPWATAMMTLLLASVRLWTGRSGEAVELAAQARRTFESLGDRYGLGQAGGTLGRSLVMVGRVEEGFELLAQAGEEGGSIDVRGAAGGQLARFTRLAAAVQIGEPERAADVVDELQTLAEVGGDDPSVALGMVALQRGDVDGACLALGLDQPPTDDPNLAAAQTLLSAVLGAPDTEERADRVASLTGATYLDRGLAQVGAALQAATQGRTEAAAARIEAAHLLVEATDDLVAQAVVGLAAAEVAHRTGAVDAADQVARAGRVASNLGIDPHGWARIFDLTARPVPA